jgi:hypothetical protein
LHGSDAKPIQYLLLAIEVGQRVLLEDAARLEEAVKLVARAEAEQLLELERAQPPGAELLECQRLERAAKSSGTGSVTFIAAAYPAPFPRCKFSRMIRTVGLNRFAVVL